MTVYDINNLEIVANHEVSATTNAENADTESMNTDNINTTETEIDTNDDVAKSDNNDNKKAIGLMAQLMKLCQQHLSCLRRCFCFSS